MLSYDTRLLFPRLRRLGECHVVHKANPAEQPPSQRGLYQLDWMQCDAIKLDDHVKWVNDHHEGKDIPFVPTLPKIIDETVCNQLFALNGEYLRAIRSHTRMARDVWNLGLSMDTMARDRALSPTAALVWSALWLLADCAYDPETQYYIRTATKIILPYAMAWKFWQYQTGRGLIWRKAKLHKLEKRQNQNVVGSPETALMEKDFIDRMKIHREDLYKSYDDVGRIIAANS